MATNSAAVHAGEVIDRSKIGKFQLLVLVLGGMVLFTDGFNTHDLGYVGFAVRDDMGLAPELLGTVLSSSIFGLFIGYIFLAPFAGYIGQKRMVVFSVGMYGVMALLSSLAADATQLMILRFLTGVALASAIPATAALIGEYAPMRRRSSFITFSYFGLSLGQLSAGAISAVLLDAYGWRSVLVAGGLIALAMVPVLLALMPESIEYLVNRGKQPEKAARALARAVPEAGISPDAKIVAGERAGQRVFVTELFQERRTVGTILIWLAIMMNLIPNYFFGNWLTTILVDQGFAQDTAIYTKMANDGAGMIVAFIAGPLMDRYGPYRVMACFFVLGGAAISLTGVALNYGAVAPIITMCFFVGLCTSGVSKGSNAVGVHFYPTALRSAGVGWGLGVGRIGAFLTPAIAGILIGLGWAASSLFYLAAAPMVIGCIAFLAMHAIYGSRSPRSSEAAVPTSSPAAAPAR